MDKTLKFIEKSKMVHGDRYDYTNTRYINSTTKVISDGCCIPPPVSLRTITINIRWTS